ncbi:MAG: FAD binding domain-containing protein [Spirochaetales bacterium]|nr:FAD binding domain-containing protein [Spirochaetales bacterium]
MKVSFLCNSRDISLNVPAGKTALDIIRRDIGFTGCREGCREGECGACTVLMGRLEGGVVVYKAVTSCLLPATELTGKHIVSIEGISCDDPNPVQQAFIETHASQCGFCTPGFILALYGFFLSGEDASLSAALGSVDGNICRCTGYNSIKKAIEGLHAQYAKRLAKKEARVEQLIGWGFLPEYFRDIPKRLQALEKECKADLQVNATRYITGGTDLFIQKADELALDDSLCSLRDDPSFSFIKTEQRNVWIGAAASIEQVRLDPDLGRLIPGLENDLLLVSSTIIRNRASIGGNIVNASPIADLVIYLLPFAPGLVLVNGKNKRHMDMSAFFLDYKKTALLEGELIREISFSVPDKARFSFRKTSRRKYLDIASVNTGFLSLAKGGNISELRISAGGLAPIPLSLHETCRQFCGASIDKKMVFAVCTELDSTLKPISDIRGSAEYKKILFRHQLVDHFCSAFPEYLDREELAGEL